LSLQPAPKQRSAADQRDDPRKDAGKAHEILLIEPVACGSAASIA
jgi:hypothetical protein